MFQVSLLNRTQKIQNNSYFGFYFIFLGYELKNISTHKQELKLLLFNNRSLIIET